MNRKPDMIWVLVFLFGLGVVTTGYAESLWERNLATNYEVSVIPQQR
ncbi:MULTISPECIES: hypothetical protein [Pseudomonas]|jgi:hypothetical protein|nr:MULTISPECIES: hypothetical protein [Pseudomonas]